MNAQVSLPTRSTGALGAAAIACLTTCIAVASVYATQAVFGDIAARFGVSITDARLSFSIGSIAYALAFFVLGPLSDLFSARRLAICGLCVAAAATVAGAITGSYAVFLVAIGVQGAAAAAVPVAMFALMPRIAPKNQIGTYFGLIIASSVVGITLGRAGMGLLSASLGLAGAWGTLAVALLAMGVLALALRDDSVGVRRQIGWSVYADSLRMIVSPDLLRPFATGFLLFFGYLGTVTFLTLRLHEPPFQFDSATIGSISLLGLGSVLGAPVSGRLVGRYGSLAVAVSGLAIVLTAIGVLVWATSLPAVGLGLFLIFLGVFVCQPAVFVRIAERVAPQRRGSASSLYLLTCLGAGSLASAVLGPVWARAGWTGVTTVCVAAVLTSLVVLISDATVRSPRAAQGA
ncbi:MFS transporter [Ideonella sp. DXS29W]|uniref:MFS transporter n=1 Tax=Ideonella lacteola TaxID=2984193 RepID=A0ABU9BXH1_9BURK